MDTLDFKKSTYIRWIKEVERSIDAEMRAYWRLVKINGSFMARQERLHRADRYIRELENYRKILYHITASQGPA